MATLLSKLPTTMKRRHFQKRYKRSPDIKDISYEIKALYNMAQKTPPYIKY